MARFFDGSSDYLEAAYVPPRSINAGQAHLEATTIAAWINLSANAAETICSIGAASPRDTFLTIISGPVYAYSTQSGPSQASANTTTSIVLNKWHHVCATFHKKTDRRAFLDGGGKGVNTTSRDTSGASRIRVGQRSTNDNQKANGMIAHLTIWNQGLDDNEVLLLSQGLSAFHIRPQAITNYWSFDNNDVDTVGGVNLFAVGSPTFRPTPPRFPIHVAPTIESRLYRRKKKGKGGGKPDKPGKPPKNPPGQNPPEEPASAAAQIQRTGQPFWRF